MSNTLKEVEKLMQSNCADFWLDNLSETVCCVVTEESEEVEYNGWSEKLTELTKSFGDLTPSAFESIKRLLAYSFKDINWDYTQLSDSEKKLTTEEEFNTLKSLVC